MSDVLIVQGVRSPGRYDATVASEADALRLARAALPHAAELPPAIVGVPYPPPPPGVRAWFRAEPAEPAVGNLLPHVKYADWTAGKKGRGGSWGHLFFPASTDAAATEVAMSVMFEVYYPPPVNEPREAELGRVVEAYGGRLDYREEAAANTGVCLTFEFDDWPAAVTAAAACRTAGAHVEGPTDYGD